MSVSPAARRAAAADAWRARRPAAAGGPSGGSVRAGGPPPRRGARDAPAGAGRRPAPAGRSLSGTDRVHREHQRRRSRQGEEALLHRTPGAAHPGARRRTQGWTGLTTPLVLDPGDRITGRESSRPSTVDPLPVSRRTTG